MLLEVDDNAWQVLAQSLALSARSKGSTKELRQQVSRALTKLREVRGTLVVLQGTGGSSSQAAVIVNQLSYRELGELNVWAATKFNQQLADHGPPSVVSGVLGLYDWVKSRNGRLRKLRKEAADWASGPVDQGSWEPVSPQATPKKTKKRRRS